MVNVTTRLRWIALALVLFGASGCSVFPSITRMENNMSQMVYYMGIMASNMPYMAQSTGRMAATAETMQRRSEGMLDSLQKRGPEVERTIQNYGQSFLDNDRAMIKSLKGIQSELGELRQSLKTTPEAGTSDQAQLNQQVRARLEKIEAKLTALSEKIGRPGDPSGTPSR